MNLIKRIVVRTQFIGFHRWKDAPDVVSFLRHWHRHVFKVEVTLDVEHSDRDLEFFIIQNLLKDLVAKWELEQFEQSCEAIAEEIFLAMNEVYPRKVVSVVVSEDGENDGMVLRADAVL